MALQRLPLVTLVGLVVVLAAACGGASGPSSSPRPTPTPTPSPSPAPTPAAELSPAQLRYLLLDQFSPISWCDPDFYPVAHADEQQLAEQRLPEIQAEGPTYAAIAAKLGIDPAASPTPDETIAIYRDWKLLDALQLEPIDGGFAFELITETNVGQGQGIHSAGTIDDHGTIDVTLQEESFLTACPICLARGTLIDTPDGPLAVEDVRVGDLVWTLDGSGRRVVRPVVRVGSMPVPTSHEVVHLVLDDGREAWVSPGHPTADGRAVGALRPGDELDGALVGSAEGVAYAGSATFDILPAGPSGSYWANGIFLGSTLQVP
jgi:hypothetical protein